MFKIKNLKVAATAAAALLLLSACGGSDADTDAGAADGGGEGLTEINVGVIPILDTVPIYLGIEAGIFEEHGLDVNLQEAQGGAAIIPGVQSGDFDIGFSNVTSLIVAKSKGLPVQLVAPGPNSTNDPANDYAAVLVPEDSDIESIEDLAGASIAINTLNNINDTVLREGMKQAGGDPESMNLVEVAFPDMQGQVEGGNVDAMVVVEPFQTIGLSAGMRSIYAPYAEPTDNMTVAGYFTTEQLIASDPELVDTFATAMREAQSYADENPEEAKEVLQTYITLDEAIVPDIVMPSFPQEVNETSIQIMIDWVVEYGLIDEPVELDEFIYRGE